MQNLCRPLNSHSFMVRLKFLGLFSCSHSQVLISLSHALNLKIFKVFACEKLKPAIKNILSTKYKQMMNIINYGI